MKLFFSLLFIAATTKSGAQINIECLRLTDPAANVFYMGIDNPIKISGLQTLLNYEVTISGGGGSLYTTGNNEYIVHVSSITDTCFIAISQFKKKIFRKQFITRTIPPATALLSGIRNTTVRRDSILANPFLSVLWPGFYFRVPTLNVTSFRAIFINGFDSTFTFAQGNQLTTEQIRLIRQKVRFDKIYFDQINATSGDFTSQNLSFWIRLQ